MQSSFGQITRDKEGRFRLAEKIGSFDPLEAIEKMREYRHEQVIKPIEDQCALFKDHVAGDFKKLRQLCEEFQKKCQGLSNGMAFNPSVKNVFKERFARPISGPVSESVIIECQSMAKITQAAHHISIKRLASHHIVSSVHPWSHIQKPLGELIDQFQDEKELTISLNAEPFKTYVIKPSDTLENLRDRFTNDKIECHLIKQSSNPNVFSLVLKTKEPAQLIQIEGEGRNILNFQEHDPRITKESLQACIHYCGVDIVRPSNKMSDVIDGVTFHLKKALNEDLAFFIDYDQEDIFNEIKSFVDSYNIFFDEVTKHMAVDEKTGKPTEEASLHSKRLFLNRLRHTITDMRLLSVHDNQSGQNLTLNQVGINFGAMIGTHTDVSMDFLPKISIDEKKLKQAIQQNPDHIVTLFGVKTASSNFSFKAWDIPIHSPKEFEISFEKFGSQYKSVFKSTQHEVSVMSQDVFIKGPKGTAFEGIMLSYLGEPLNDGEKLTSNITASHGVASQMFKNLSPLLARDNGDFDKVFKELEDENKHRLSTIEKKQKVLDKEDAAKTSKLSQLYASHQQATRIQSLLKSLQKRGQE